MNTKKLREDLAKFDELFTAACYKIREYHFPFLKEKKYKDRKGHIETDYSCWDDRGIEVIFSIPPACNCCPNDDHYYTIPETVITEEGLNAYIEAQEEEKTEKQKKKEQEELEAKRKAEEEKIKDEKKKLKELAQKYPDRDIIMYDEED